MVKGIVVLLVGISLQMSVLLFRQGQLLEAGAAEAGLGFGWVFFYYATLSLWAAAGVALVILFLTSRR